jgi:hypothetical protein
MPRFLLSGAADCSRQTVSIPNTEVKPAGADGTARVTAWESRKSPGLFRSPLDQLERALVISTDEVRDGDLEI